MFLGCEMGADNGPLTPVAPITLREAAVAIPPAASGHGWIDRSPRRVDVRGRGGLRPPLMRHLTTLRNTLMNVLSGGSGHGLAIAELALPLGGRSTKDAFCASG